MPTPYANTPTIIRMDISTLTSINAHYDTQLLVCFTLTLYVLAHPIKLYGILWLIPVTVKYGTDRIIEFIWKKKNSFLSEYMVMCA